MALPFELMHKFIFDILLVVYTFVINFVAELRHTLLRELIAVGFGWIASAAVMRLKGKAEEASLKIHFLRRNWKDPDPGERLGRIGG